ncbi:hypothetical protein AXF42_Ash017196 [Apostasia shenzhenica]|uniref:Negative regulator of systemic acquired resistance SNI1 n=1 Tax=Apostasia shenzhenica TaxID=1088818 RepID=A0A2H9ZVC5_9ASPA|nr:hypothetical protein AXF42_Ash017196 [Apostasia shenzhenica]
MADVRKHTQGLEDNILAILDTTGVREARDVHDDRLAFLEAVRAASLASVSPYPPSWKIFDAIFHILRDGNSLELLVASYQLLTDLDQRYPRVFLKDSETLGPGSGGARELVVAKEAWSPFWDLEASYAEHSEPCEESNVLFDSLTFSILIEDIAMMEDSGTKAVKNMLLFRYLVCVLEADFLPRQASYQETSNWFLLRESILNMLLVSRKMQFKSLVRNCISVVSEKCHHQNFSPRDDERSDSPGIPHVCNVGLSFAFTGIERETCDAMRKLFMLIVELDVIRQEADTRGSISRSDGFRVPVLDNVLDVLTYDKDLLSPFLEENVLCSTALSQEAYGTPISRVRSSTEPPSTRTRSSKDSPNDTFESILNCFSTVATGRILVKKVTSKVALLLIAHAFQGPFSTIIGCFAHFIMVVWLRKLKNHLNNHLLNNFRGIAKAPKDIETFALLRILISSDIQNLMKTTLGQATISIVELEDDQGPTSDDDKVQHEVEF